MSSTKSDEDERPIDNLDTRLAELHRWQAEQAHLLVERQMKQRQQLSVEQQNMYKELGLQYIEEKSADDEEISHDEEKHDDERAAETQLMKRSAPLVSFQPTSEDFSDDVFDIPKRKFLRRGEGLKQRFGIDPEKLRLNNLPRYKYAGARRRADNKKPASLEQASINAQPSQVKRLIVSKALPIQSKKAAPKNTKPTTKNDTPVVQAKPKSNTALAATEHRFQERLLSSAATCSSTPDQRQKPPTKSSPEQRSSSPKKTTPTAVSQAMVCSGPAPTWAKVLDSQRITPLRLERRHAWNVSIEDENVSIFELIEQKAREGNVDMNASCVRRFMGKRDERSSDTSNIIPVRQSLHQLRLEPAVNELMLSDDDKSEDSNENEAGNADEDVDDSATIEDFNREEEQTVEPSAFTNETTNSSVARFEQFKAVLFQALENRNQEDDELGNDDEPQRTLMARKKLTAELEEKTNLVKARLTELEREITKFRESNDLVNKLKEQHEEERELLAQQHAEATEKLHDERIQAEIYLHDERMKIEEERRKFEEQMRLQKSGLHSKDKKEIVSLRQQVEELQLQLKQKEQAHVTAQARLRAQIRNLEREQRGFYERIDQLNKENKRLQQEAISIGRENNNKVLQEIKRNIARLAPKMETETQTKEVNEARLKRAVSLPEAPTNEERAQVKARKSDHSILRKRTTAPRQTSDSNSTETKQTKRHTVTFSKPPSSNDSGESSEESASVGLKPRAEQLSLPVDEKDRCNTSKDAVVSISSGDNSSTSYKRELVNADGSKDIWYPNGNIKKISADGMIVRMLYFNKDIKETNIRAGTTKYYYHASNTWHTTYLDGLQILEFPNGHVEHRHKNGVVEVHLPDNVVKIVDPGDELKSEEWRYADGTKLFKMRNGAEVVLMPNGQKEIRTKQNRRREYPDGTVKIVYPDGTQETRYSNGRVRLKDKEGRLIMDTDNLK